MRDHSDEAQLAVLLTRRANSTERLASLVEIRVAARLMKEGRISETSYRTLVSEAVGRVASHFYASPPQGLRKAHRTVLRRLFATSQERTVEVA